MNQQDKQINIDIENTTDLAGVAREPLESRNARKAKPFIQLSLITAIVFVSFLLLFEYEFPPSAQYAYLFCLILGFAVFSQKYHKVYSSVTSTTFSKLTVGKSLAWLYTFFFTTLVVTLTELRDIPRSFLFSTLIVAYSIDLLVSLVQHNPRSSHGRGSVLDEVDEEPADYVISYRKAGLGFVLLIMSTLLAMVIKSMSVQLYSHYEQLFVLIVVSWLISIGLTRGYSTENHRNIYYAIAPVLKLSIATAVFAGAFYWYGQLEYISRGVLFGSIGLFALLQFLTDLILSDKHTPAEKDLPIPESAARAANTVGSKIADTENSELFELDKYIPKHVVMDGRRGLEALLKELVPATDPVDTSILFYAEEENLRNLGTDRKVIINLHALNHVQNVNEFLRQCRWKMSEQGYFITWFYPLETTHSRLRASMPKSVFVLAFPLHFLLFRVVPKLPFVGKIFFYIAKGRNYNMSKVEVLGRLAYNGFSVVGLREIRHKLYVVARADRSVLHVEPSFGPIAKLGRIGYEGRNITIYKFRTMYPYSEFIQDDMYQVNGGIDARSKFVNDYRITLIGRILRRYWIDELPQLYNWLKGDVGLVGVRALSAHKFSLYPPEIQQLRIRYKPGLIPPLYADLPTNFEEIVRSEERYLNSWSRRPFVTDVRYFCKALYNILVKGARSS